MIFDEANNSEVAPGLHAQKEELDELIEQLQLEYDKIKCAEHKIRNLGEQNIAREAKLEFVKSKCRACNQIYSTNDRGNK